MYFILVMGNLADYKRFGGLIRITVITVLYCFLYAVVYGTNHIKLNILQVWNGHTRTRSIPVLTKWNGSLVDKIIID